MAIGTTALIMAAMGVAGGMAASKMSSGGNKSQAVAPTPLPQAPSPEASSDSAVEIAKRKRAGMSQTTFTSPLGIGDQAQIAKKTLLGQ
jgi:hypothetical protein